MSCNGKCYIIKQLKQQQENDFDSLQISMKDYPIGFVNLLLINEVFTDTLFVKNLSNYIQNYSYLVYFSVFHPPKV